MGLDPVSAGFEGLQAAFGVVQTLTADAKIKKLMAQRKAFVTPDEIYKMLNLALSQTGGDTQTRDFQTTQIDRTFGQMIGVATRLGADPNDLSMLFDQKVNNIMKVGQEFHASNMASFSKVFDAFNLLAENKAAEQKSQQDIIKDKLQAAGLDKAAGFQNLGNAINSFISNYASGKTSGLFTGDKSGSAPTGGDPANG